MTGQSGSDSVVLVTKEVLGNVAPEDAAFGTSMLEKFLHTLEASERKPRAICFYTEGVKNLCADSSLVEGLRLLEGMEIRLVACGSCLDYYGLAGELQLGEVVGMNEIVALMMEADSVITV